MTIDDDLLGRAAGQARDEMLGGLPEEPEHVFSELFERKLRRMIREQGKSPRRQSLTRWARRAAVLIVTVFVGFSTCVLSVEAWRVKLFEMVERKHPEYSDIRYERVAGSGTEEQPRYDLVEYRPAFIPEGYRLVSQILNGGVNWMNFENAQGGRLSFDQSVIGTSGSAINTEGSQLEPFSLNGEAAFKMDNRGAKFVLWSDERYEFMLISMDEGLTLDETVRIAESVTVSPRGAYHPPKPKLELDDRPLDYPPETAVRNGDVTVRDDGKIENEETLNAFFDSMKRGEPTVICVADYSGSTLLVHELLFDGLYVQCRTDVTRRDPDAGSSTVGSEYRQFYRETKNGETVVWGIDSIGEKDAFLRYGTVK